MFVTFIIDLLCIAVCLLCVEFGFVIFLLLCTCALVIITIIIMFAFSWFPEV